MEEKNNNFTENLAALVKAKKVSIEDARKHLKQVFIHKDIDDKGNIYSTNVKDIMKLAADSPEELQQLMQEEKDYELKNLKNKDYRFDGTTSRFVDSDGDYTDKIKNFAELHKARTQVRKEAVKLLGNNSEVNKFMKAKSFDDYKKLRDKKIYKPPTTMTQAFDNVVAGVVPKSPVTPASTPVQKVPDPMSVMPETKGVKGAASKETFEQMDLEKYIAERAELRRLKNNEELIKKHGDGGIVRLVLDDKV